MGADPNDIDNRVNTPQSDAMGAQGRVRCRKTGPSPRERSASPLQLRRGPSTEKRNAPPAARSAPPRPPPRSPPSVWLPCRPAATLLVARTAEELQPRAEAKLLARRDRVHNDREHHDDKGGDNNGGRLRGLPRFRVVGNGQERLAAEVELAQAVEREEEAHQPRDRHDDEAVGEAVIVEEAERKRSEKSQVEGRPDPLLWAGGEGSERKRKARQKSETGSQTDEDGASRSQCQMRSLASRIFPRPLPQRNGWSAKTNTI